MSVKNLLLNSVINIYIFISPFILTPYFRTIYSLQLCDTNYYDTPVIEFQINYNSHNHEVQNIVMNHQNFKYLNEIKNAGLQ